MQQRDEDEWLWGWDATPGIVSVWAERTGRAMVWRRAPGGPPTREEDRFHPWLLLQIPQKALPRPGPGARWRSAFRSLPVSWRRAP